MKYVFIGTYPPRECGIGTFTKNLRASVVQNPLIGNSFENFIVALNDHENNIEYGKEVKFTIRQDAYKDYTDAAEFINQSGADVCILEHEFGIFGGQNGIYVLSLMHKIKIPIITTLHTVIKAPSCTQKSVFKEICNISHKVVVMSFKAVQLLGDIYNVPKEKIERIEHGVPDLIFNNIEAKKGFNLEHRKVILTFGLIGRNKGIETMIKALPAVIKKFPEVIYVVLGKTHPNVKKYSGEEYRDYLMQTVKKLRLENHVLFLNKFVEQQELFKYLSASDIYVTPYIHKAQITSGTLSYAVGVGSAVVSTPYWHARELLSEGRGTLFDFNDSAELSSIILHLLDNPDELKKIRNKAFKYGRKITWPKIGKEYVNLAENVVKTNGSEGTMKRNVFNRLKMPDFSADHLLRLTDDTGIIQHAKYAVPNRKDGYCTDDNARALLMTLKAYKQTNDVQLKELAGNYLSFLLYMQNEDGTFRNFLNYKREYLDENGTEDSFGRAIWSVGYLLNNAPDGGFYQTARDIFYKALPNFLKLKSIRSIAFTLIGICHYMKYLSFDEELLNLSEELANKLIIQYENEKNEKWKWYEPVMAYDNAMLPLSLLYAYEFLKNDIIKKTAFETMNFLIEQTLTEDGLSLIGNKNWFKKDGIRSVFDQQPIDASAMVLLFHKAYQLTKEISWLKKAVSSFMWFSGENDLRIPLYNFDTGGCCDGLEEFGVNQNQGAESTIAYWTAYFTVSQSLSEVEKFKTK